MRIDIFLKSASRQDSIKFYTEELAMFFVVNDFGTGFCTLRANEAPNLNLILAGWYNVPGPSPRIGLSVKDCHLELKRLKAVTFESGGGIVPNSKGEYEVFEYPGGRNLTLRDPDNNKILLFEDFGDPV